MMGDGECGCWREVVEGGKRQEREGMMMGGEGEQECRKEGREEYNLNGFKELDGGAEWRGNGEVRGWDGGRGGGEVARGATREGRGRGRKQERKH